MRSKSSTLTQSQNADCSMVTISLPPELRRIEQILFASVKQNRLDLVNKIIQDQKCDINVRDNFDRTPLHLASSSGNLSIVKALVMGRAIIDPIDKFGITPLFWAVYNNHRHVVHYLLDAGAKHNRHTKQGFTIMHFIAESNAISILKCLYKKFQVLDYDLSDNNGMTPFLIAASKGNLRLIEILIKRKCNILKKNMHARNALHLASKNGHIETLECLLSLKKLREKIDEMDIFETTPLHLACENNQKECVRILLEHGAQPDISTSNHACPLIECSRKGFHKCIDLLLENNADKEKKTKTGETALHEAAMANLTDTIYFLFSRKFNLTAVNDRLQTPLHYAISQNKLEAVEALLFCGAPLDLIDKDGLTPLMVAAKANYTALVDMIIRADRWRKTYPENAESFLDEIINMQENKCATPTVQSRRYRPKPRKNVKIANNAKDTISDSEDSNNNDDDGDDDDDSGTYVGQKSLASLRNESAKQQNSPQFYPSNILYSPSSSVHNDDLKMSEFIDPFKQLNASFVNSNNKNNNNNNIDRYGYAVNNNNMNNKNGRFVNDHRSRSTASSESGSELSLGYEASRDWSQRQHQHHQQQHSHQLQEDSSANGINSSAIRVNNKRNNTNISSSEINLHSSASTNNGSHYNNSSRRNKHNLSRNQQFTSLTDLSQHIKGEEIQLPNGEKMFRINSGKMYQSNRNMRLISGYGLNVSNPFTLRAPCQTYAEDMNILFFEYSHQYAKPMDWRNLAEFWGFTSEDVTAIACQDIGKNSYKEHTYRLLNIWLHGVGDNQSPLNELYLALTTIGRKRIASLLQKRINGLGRENSKHSRCKVS
ncbi:unnamed protein product [Trichobilharzia szidati]|nr:unnamed protein product [Trichobilharzia szidati]